MSATTDPGNRSAADIEADVEQTRVQVAETIVALRESMSPGQIMDQVVDYARTSGGAEFTRNLGAQLRDNPLPVLLIGAGIGWLLLSSGNRQGASGPVRPLPPERMLPPPPSSMQGSSGPGMMERAAQATANARDGIGQTATRAGSSISQAASGVSNAVGQAAGSVAGAVSSAISSVGDAASSAGGKVSGMASNAAAAAGSAHDTARAYGHDATHVAGQGIHAAAHGVNQFGRGVGTTGGQLGDHLRQSWNRASTEQPLLLGALGLALGAVVGALLPRTRTEDRLMGEASDAVTQQLGAAVQEQYAQAKDVVSERVDEVREKLGENAPSVSALGDSVVDAAQEVRKAVSQSARDLEDGAKSGMDKAEKDAGLRPDKPAAKPEGDFTAKPKENPARNL